MTLNLDDGSFDRAKIAGLTSFTDLYAVAADSSQNYYIAGVMESGGSKNGRVVKINKNLDVLWTYDFDGSLGYDDVFKSVALNAAEDQVYICGYESGDDSKDLLVQSIDTAGVFQWQYKLSDSRNSEGNSIAVRDGEVFVGGYEEQLGTKRGYLSILSESGIFQDSFSVYNKTSLKDSEIRSVVVDSTGNVFFTVTAVEVGASMNTVHKYKRHLILEDIDGYASDSRYFIKHVGQLRGADSTVQNVKYYCQDDKYSYYFFDDKFSIVKKNVDTVLSTIDTIHRVDVSFHGSGNRSTYGVTHRKTNSLFLNFYIDSVRYEDVQAHGSLIYPEIYQDIDLIFEFDEAGIKYYFSCKSNSQPADIRFQVTGDLSTSILNDTFSISTLAGPILYNDLSSYNFDGNFDPQSYNYSNVLQTTGLNMFKLDTTNLSTAYGAIIKFSNTTPMPNAPLPAENMKWSTYYGGSEQDEVKAITSSDVFTSRLYVTGETGSSNFPSIGEQELKLSGVSDIFVIGFKQVNRQRVFVTIIGGGDVSSDTQEFERVHDMVVDNLDNVYIGGMTNNKDFMQVDDDGGYTDPDGNNSSSPAGKGFLCKLRGQNGELKWSTLIGDKDRGVNLGGCGLGITSTNHLILAGDYQTNFLGLQDVELPIDDNNGQYFSQSDGTIILAEFDSQNDLIWCTPYGPAEERSSVFDLVVDNCDNFILVGQVHVGSVLSTDVEVDYELKAPVPASFYDTFVEGTEDGLVVKFYGTDKEVYWGTVFGKHGRDLLSGIDVDQNGNIYAVGSTQDDEAFEVESDISFPIDAYFDSDFNGGIDNYFTKFSSTGQLLYSSLYGGIQDEFPLPKVKVTNDGNVAIATSSASLSSTEYPDPDDGVALFDNDEHYFQDRLNNPDDTGSSVDSGDSDGLILLFTNQFVPLCSTFIGGIVDDKLNSLTILDKNLYIGGNSNSSTPSFPTLDPGIPAYFQPIVGGEYDGTITEFLLVDEIVHTTDYSDLLEGSEIVAFPNPTTGTVVLKHPFMEQSNGLELQIFRTDGHLIASELCASSNGTIEYNCSDYPAGVYIIKLSTQGGTAEAKLVKQ